LGAGEIEFLERDTIANKVSEDGSVTLSWSKADEVIVELQQAVGAKFENPMTRYSGNDAGSVLTGLSEGEHYFRIGEKGTGEWSEPLEVTVEFVSRRTLFWLLGAGSIVVLATIGAIVVGHFWREDS